jgi:hypothetical protein
MARRRITKKLKRKNYISKRTYKSFKGGRLIMNESDLKNTHICKTKDMDKYKESPGFEVYVAISESFGLNSISKEFFLGTFTKKNNKWFKFVI